MDLEKLKNILLNVLLNFFYKDLFLLENNAHEQSISHKIAYYLENELRDFLDENNYSVDVEYNKRGKDPKEFKYIMSEFKEGNFKIYDKNDKLICEYGKVFIKEGNYCLGVIEEGYNCFIGEQKDKGKNEIKIHSKGIRPDIIVHRRDKNNDLDNLLVFEIKKDSLDNSDIIKLKGLTNKNLNFGYKYGIGLYNFNVSNNSCEIDIFENGEKIENLNFTNGRIN